MAEAMHADKVVGLQWNYTTTLYRQIALLHDLRNAGQYYHALRVLLQIIQFSPKQMQDLFKEKVEVIEKGLVILTQKLKEKAIDDFNYRALRDIKRNEFSQLILHDFYPQVENQLDLRGYKEKTAPKVPTGVSHTERRS